MFVVLQDAGELLLLRAEVGDIPKGGNNWMDRRPED